MSPTSPAKSSVRLEAYDHDGHPVLEESLPLDAFYEDSHPVLDDPEYRRTHQISVLNGTVYGAEGGVLEEFEVRFDAEGSCLGDAARAGAQPETRRRSSEAEVG